MEDKDEQLKMIYGSDIVSISCLILAVLVSIFAEIPWWARLLIPSIFLPFFIESIRRIFGRIDFIKKEKGTA